MRLSNLEEGSFWGRDDLVKRMKDEEKAAGMKKFVKNADGVHHAVTTSDKEKWEELKAQGYKEDENYFNEAEVSVDNEGNIAGYLATIDEYVEMLFKSAEGTDNAKATEIAYRIQNAVDDIRTRELGLKPSLIRAKYNKQIENANYDTKDFEFNPNAGHRDQLSHPENRGLGGGSDLVPATSPRPKSRPKNLKAPKTSPRPKARPKDLEMKHNINKAVQQAVASEGKSPHKKGTAKYKKHMAAMHAEGTHSDTKLTVREAGSPWTTTGKHPEKMTTDELWTEIAVFDELQDRGETLSPKDMMRLDSLFSYMDTAEMNEQIKRKADSMMESAVWKAKRNK